MIDFSGLQILLGFAPDKRMPLFFGDLFQDSLEHVESLNKQGCHNNCSHCGSFMQFLACWTFTHPTLMCLHPGTFSAKLARKSKRKA